MAQAQGWTPVTDPSTATGWTPVGPASLPAFKQTDTTPNEVDPNTVGTLLRHLWNGINPIQIGQLLPFPKVAGGSGMDNPLLPSNIAQQLHAVKLEGDKAWEKGDKVTAVAKYVESVIPFLGPMLSQQGNEWQQGKTMAALGDTGAMATTAALPGAVEAGSKLLARTGASAAADAAATDRIADVISPKYGANRARFGNMAQDVAPTVARKTTGMTRGTIADSIASKLDDATSALDEAADSRLNAKSYPTGPIISALKAARDKLTAQAVDASQFTPQSGVTRPPLGEDVIPGPNAARVAPIDAAIQEVQQLGPVAKYESLRRIRQAYDGPSKAVYSPAVTADFLKAQGGKLGAADVTGTLRDYLAQIDPQTAAANADYSLWKKASDVITAAEEADRGRPTVGRSIMARSLGAMAGAGVDGGVGAAVGAVVGPTLERIAANASPAIKVVVARQLATLSDALKAGDFGRAKSLLSIIQKMLPASQRGPIGSMSAPTLVPAQATAGSPQ